MPPYGPHVVHILRIIRHNNCDHLLKAFYKACIMDWAVAVVPSLVDSSFVTWAQVQRSVAMVRTNLLCIFLSLPRSQLNFVTNKFILSEIGIICIFVLGAFVFINFYRKEEGFVTDIPQTEDPHKVSEFMKAIGKQMPSK